MKKRILKIALSAFATICTILLLEPSVAISTENVDNVNTTIIEEEANYQSGDVNFDGRVNAIDASIVLHAYARYQTGEEPLTPLQKDVADVNKDGFINAVDASEIMTYYSHLATTTEDTQTLTLKDFLANKSPSISTTEIQKIYYKPNTHYIHTADCHWCNEDLGKNEELIEIENTNDIECRKCSECNPEIEIINEYVEPVSNVITSGVSEYDYTLLCKIVASEYGGMADTYERAKIVASVMNMVNDSRWPGTVEGVLDQSCAPWGFNKYAEYYCGGSVHYSAMSDAVDYYFNNPDTFAGWTCNQWYGDGQRNHFRTI